MRWPSNAPAPIRGFEYEPRTRRLGAPGLVLWVAALAFAADVGWGYAETRSSLHARTQELAKLVPGAEAAREAKLYQPKDLERETLFARTTVNRIALPWNDLFKALRSSTVEGVLLQGIEPDADSGALQITAQADDIPSMLTYIARLESNSYFPTVALQRHEVLRNDPRRPVEFIVVATWKHKP